MSDEHSIVAEFKKRIEEVEARRGGGKEEMAYDLGKAYGLKDGLAVVVRYLELGWIR